MTLKLNSNLRTLIGKKAQIIRQEGKIPAVVYGHGLENQNIELDYNAFDKVFKEGGESTIIDLGVDGKEVKVIVSDVQYDPVKGRYRHVDFHQIKMDEAITANVELKFVGEAKAVKEFDGVLVHNISELEIKCLPGDLVGEIEVDVSKLNTFDDVVTIADLVISDKIEIIGHEPEDVVAIVTKPRAEEVNEPVAAVEAAPVAGEEGKEENKEKESEAK
ncbi:MAG: 50S ribosomal protein L25 [Candidatus Buchananbacteria bacterium]|nr:50S ribosomal protein L25 [Candidatus Buchananbacteria bacterium]